MAAGSDPKIVIHGRPMLLPPDSPMLCARHNTKRSQKSSTLKTAFLSSDSSSTPMRTKKLKLPITRSYHRNDLYEVCVILSY